MVMSKASVIALCRGGVLLGMLSGSLLGCRKDEPPPPLPAAPKAAEPVAEAPLQLQPEDAGKPPEPPAPAAKPSASKSSGSLTACCTALRQNAANAPEPNKGYMTYAAQICDMAAAQGKEKASIVGTIQATLKGAGLPSSCK
jgi:hypothetical protein